MASPSTAYRNDQTWKPPSSSATAKTPFSLLNKTVVLNDWWLIKVEGGSNGSIQLGVGGTTFRGPAIRVFCSGAIAKRHDNFTLETFDGITVNLTGLINRSRTFENGFSSKVCTHFVLGFPFEWEELGAQCFGEESTNGTLTSKSIKMSDDGADCIFIEDLPVTRIRDHLMISSGDYNECKLTRSIFDGILNEYGGSLVLLNEDSSSMAMTKDSLLSETRPSLHSNEEHSGPITTKNCLLDEDVSERNKNQPKNLIKNQSATLSEENKEVDKTLNSSAVKRSSRPKDLGDVATRRESRSKKSINTNTSVNQELGDPISASEVSGNQCGGKISSVDASNPNVPDKLSQDKTEVETLDNSAARKSYRRENSSTGFYTRSKARLESLRSDPEDNIVAFENSVVTRSGHGKKLSDPFPTPEASGKKTRSDASSSGHFINESSRVPGNSVVRRSNRIRSKTKKDVQRA